MRLSFIYSSASVHQLSSCMYFLVLYCNWLRRLKLFKVGVRQIFFRVFFSIVTGLSWWFSKGCKFWPAGHLFVWFCCYLICSAMKDSCPLSLIIYGTKTNIQRLRNSTNLTRPTRPNMTAGTTVDVVKSKLGLERAQRDVMTLVSNQFKWFCPASFSPVFVVVARPLTEIKWNLWVYFIKFKSYMSELRWTLD